MTSGLDITRHYGWAEIRIDRETKRNAMDRATRQAMLAAFEELRPSAKAIVITGTGMAFCAGMDLKEREQDRLAGIDGAGDEWVSVNIAIRKHPAIFIAAVNGVALGGGATLIIWRLHPPRRALAAQKWASRPIRRWLGPPFNSQALRASAPPGWY